MTAPDTKREQEVAALFKSAGDAARAALTSARDATERQAAIIVDLQGQLAGATANTVDDATLAAWTDTVNQAVTSAAEIQKAFDAIGVPPTQPPTVIPPEIIGLPPQATHPDTGIPHPGPVKKK